ncbi:73aee939-6f86-4e08-aad8-251dcb7b4b11 [Thermothielavioides terrestris]|uniref:73aee939-6f86-4e08-aad8-251dcb7b4b11 n=1 Tax=Thermothielavioides terrestris TaxID=2587410 RepID=A0A3S4BQQ8_9PEZI|nr:73aee939-6f86-4e08-aad8-251dcb7b4b11 [Thermothielavioides terrestris]
MDVFDLAGFMEGNTEVFRSSGPGQYLRLIDDHQSGVFTTPSDAPVSVRIEPRQISTVERVPAQNGAACVVKITYRASADGGGGTGGGAGGGASPSRTQTLVLETTRSTASGMQTGMVHARRLCRRLGFWNPDILCPAPAAANSDPFQWRFGTSSDAPQATSVARSTEGPATA